MIQIITRIRFPELYRKMQETARATAKGPLMFTAAHDDGDPKLAESYNLLGSCSMADILLFVHDDISFLSDGWDEKIEEAIGLGFNLVGVVGSKEYKGGMVFDSGREHSAGRLVCNIGDKRMVKIMENISEVEPVKVVDGMFMAMTRDHFLRSGGFDARFDGLFYYDMDMCLRSNCAVVNILVAHEKPSHLRGDYPKDIRTITDYEGLFNSKHGFPYNPPIGDQSCGSMSYNDYKVEA